VIPFVLEELAKLHSKLRPKELRYEQLPAIYLNGSMLTRVVDLEYTVGERLAAVQSGCEFHADG